MSLPTPATTFVGRIAELARLSAAVAEGCRIVTLFGPGGVGKTRLALQYARLHEQSGLFCDLTVATDLTTLCRVVARALGVQLTQRLDDEAILSRLGDVLAARPERALILDNCEHVVEAAASAVAHWCRVAPAQRFLITSRELLRVPGEVAFEVGPLRVPNETADRGDEQEAVQLFVDRARLVRPDFVLGEATAKTVAALVRRLDGLPLAIELAAARTNVLGLAALFERIGGDLDLLTVNARETPGRQKTMRATIEWSWRLLSTAEQEALRQATVFRGSFSLEAACAVIALPSTGGDGSGPSTDSPRVVDLLGSLCDKSLLRSVRPAEDGEVRFRFYDTIRSFASERLAVDEPATSAAQLRHASFFVGQGSKALDVRAGAVTERERRLGLDLDNLLAAGERLRQGEAPRKRDALVIALALERLLLGLGEAQTLLELIDASMSGPGSEEIESPLRARGLVVRGDSRGFLDSLSSGRSDLEAGLALAEKAGDDIAIGRALAALARWDPARWDPVSTGPEAFQRLVDRALSAQRRAGDKEAEGRTLIYLADVSYHHQRSRAHEAVAAAAICAREAGDLSVEVMAAGTLADMHLREGDLEAALAHSTHAVQLAERAGDAPKAARAECTRARILHEMGRWKDARETHENALLRMRRTGDAHVGYAVGYFAIFLQDIGETSAAARFYEESILLLERAERRLHELIFRGYRAALAADEGQIGRAHQDLDDLAAEARRQDNVALLELFDVQRGHVDLARARERARSGDLTEVVAHGKAAVDRLREVARETPLADDVRLARRVLERAAAKCETTVLELLACKALLVDSAGRWFQRATETRIEVGSPRLQRLLAVLAGATRATTGAPVSMQGLFDAAWQGESALPTAAANRVRVAIKSLRDLGLRDLLLFTEGGYTFGVEVLCIEAPLFASTRGDGTSPSTVQASCR